MVKTITPTSSSSAPDTPATMSSTTYLRVHRRRHAGTTALTIRLEGLDGGRGAGEGSGSHSAPAIWRRVNKNDSHHTKQRGKRNCRVLDALLEDGEHCSKKRRLTLIGEASSNTESKPKSRTQGAALRILPPSERLVDDSLQKTFSGDISVARHYEFVTTDPRLADCAFAKWMAWTNTEFGNVLHACAMWNNVEMTCRLASLSPKHLLDSLTTAGDAEGRTPYQVAELSGNLQVCEVLAAFGCDTHASPPPSYPPGFSHNNYPDDDDSFVVDLYCLEQDYQDNTSNLICSTEHGEENEDEEMIPCQLQGGYGYWDDSGQLVLTTTAGGRRSNGDDDDGNDEEEDVDSNHEDYSGNDYPDEYFDVDDDLDPAFVDHTDEEEEKEDEDDDFDALYDDSS